MLVAVRYIYVYYSIGFDYQRKIIFKRIIVRCKYIRSALEKCRNDCIFIAPICIDRTADTADRYDSAVAVVNGRV